MDRSHSVPNPWQQRHGSGVPPSCPRAASPRAGCYSSPTPGQHHHGSARSAASPRVDRSHSGPRAPPSGVPPFSLQGSGRLTESYPRAGHRFALLPLAPQGSLAADGSVLLNTHPRAARPRVGSSTISPQGSSATGGQLTESYSRAAPPRLDQSH